MGLAFEHAGVDESIDIFRADRAIADPALRAPDLDQRLQPIHAARAGSHDLGLETALLERFSECGRDLLGADAERAGIAGDVDARAQLCASLTRASSLAESSMPCTWLSRMAAGEEWQRPRQ